LQPEALPSLLLTVTHPYHYPKEQEDEMADERLPQMAGARMGLARAAGSSARKRARG